MTETVTTAPTTTTRTTTSTTGRTATPPAGAAEPEPVRYSPSWLGLREEADVQARSRELADLLARELADREGDRTAPVVVHDLGCGTGSMARWLAPLLPGPQRWVLHDRDPQLLELAAAGMPTAAADGAPVDVEVRVGDLTELTAGDLAGAHALTASALLDLLTTQEVDRLAAVCAELGCPALFALSVSGRVELEPADALDAEVIAAFNAHQRRRTGGRTLLGPDAVTAAGEAFTRLGGRVEVRSTPWELTGQDAALATQWLLGWVGAAAEQRPDLSLDGYLDRRLASAAAGRLRVGVGHEDLLARWNVAFRAPRRISSRQ